MDNIQCIQYDPVFWKGYVTAIIICIAYVILVILVIDSIFEFEDKREKTFNFDSMTGIQEWANYVLMTRKKIKQNEHDKLIGMGIIGILTLFIAMGLRSYDQFFVASSALFGAAAYFITVSGMKIMNEYGKWYGFIGTIPIIAFMIYCAKILSDDGNI